MSLCGPSPRHRKGLWRTRGCGLLLLALGSKGAGAQLGHGDLTQVYGQARGGRVYVRRWVVELDAVWAARLGVVDDVLLQFLA